MNALHHLPPTPTHSPPGSARDSEFPPHRPAPHRDGSRRDPGDGDDGMPDQHRDIFLLMRDGLSWWTLAELERATGHPQASISARIRDFRKSRFGGYDVRKRRCEGSHAWEYRIAGKKRAKVGEGVRSEE